MSLKKALIPVAGRGTRFLPATKEVPKEMLPLLNRPMIEYVVDEAIQSGIEQIIFVTSTGKESLENYFDRNWDLEVFLEKNNKIEELELVRKIGTKVEIISVRQKEQLGLGHAVLCGKEIIGNEPFAVLLGDDMVFGEKPVTKQIYSTYKEHGGSVIGVMEIDPNDSDKYGIVDGDEISTGVIKMKGMVEKPEPSKAPSRYATPGRYIFMPSIFDYLEKIPKGAGGEYQLTDAINMMCQNESVFAHCFEGRRIDTGKLSGYLEATMYLASRDPELKKVIEEFK